MKTIVVVALFVLGLAQALPRQAHRKIKLPRISRVEGNFNEYFDEITPNIQEFIIEQGFDPLALPDLIESFNVTDLLGIEWHGELGLSNGWLTDLSLFERAGDAYLSYDDLQLNISIVLGFPDLALTYDFVAQIMDIGPEGNVFGKIEEPQLLIEAGALLSDLQLQLYNLEFTDYGRLTVEIESGGLIGFIENALLDLVTLLFEGPIMDFVQVAAEDLVQQFLDSVDLGDIITGRAGSAAGATVVRVPIRRLRPRPVLDHVLERKH